MYIHVYFELVYLTAKFFNEIKIGNISHIYLDTKYGYRQIVMVQENIKLLIVAICPQSYLIKEA